MENQYAVCPNCLKPALGVNPTDNNMLTCSECNKDIGIDVYIMSMEIIQKNILVQAVKLLFQMKNYKESGLCVSYQDRKYIVGFDKHKQLVVSQYDSCDWREGSIVKLTLDYTQEERMDETI